MSDMAEKVDLKKTMESYRARKGRLDVIEVPALRYLMIDGRGDPNQAPEFASAIEALYPVAYGLKFASRDATGRDHVVPPLEGLWWADDATAFTTGRDKMRWRWTLMVLVPPWVPDDLVAAAQERAVERRPEGRSSEVRLETLDEGTCVQTLHLGSFDDEGPVLQRVHEFAVDQGFQLSGTHHEVYFSDVRKTPPQRRRTLLRQPVAASDDRV